MAPDAVSEVELPLFDAHKCYVHVRIPPCDTLGHRADKWDVQHPDYECALKCLSKGDTLLVRLLAADGQLFAESFWHPDKPMSSIVDATVDSSRYFALSLQNPENPRARVFIGLGFPDRDVAGQFKLTLQEHGRRNERARLAAQQTSYSAVASESDGGGGSVGAAAAAPAKDMSLKGNIRIEVPALAQRRSFAGVAAKPMFGHAGGLQLQPPPPVAAAGMQLQPPPPVAAAGMQLQPPPPAPAAGMQLQPPQELPAPHAWATKASPGGAEAVLADAEADADGDVFGDFVSS